MYPGVRTITFKHTSHRLLRRSRSNLSTDDPAKVTCHCLVIFFVFKVNEKKKEKKKSQLNDDHFSPRRVREERSVPANTRDTVNSPAGNGTRNGTPASSSQIYPSTFTIGSS